MFGTMEARNIRLNTCLIFVLILSLTIVGCKRTVNPSPSATQNSGTESSVKARDNSALQTVVVKGEVFIKTRGGQNIRLGLVEVKAMPIAHFDVITDEISARVKDGTQKLVDAEAIAQAQINLYNNKVDYLQGLNHQLKRSASLFEAEIGRRDDDTLNTAFQVAVSSRRNREEKIKSRIDELRTKHLSLQSSMDTLIRQGSQIVPEIVDDVLMHAIRNVTVSKTDSAGKFKLQLSKGEVYVLIATDSRSVGDTIENYRWAVKVDSQSFDSGDQLTLSNDNMFDGDDETNLLKNFFRYRLATMKLSTQAKSALASMPDVPSIPEESPRLAPDGFAYLRAYVSMRTRHGMAGYPPGTMVNVVADHQGKKQVKFQEGVCEVDSKELTYNLDNAETLMLADNAQQSELQAAAEDARAIDSLRKMRDLVRSAEDIQNLEMENKQKNTIGAWDNPLNRAAQ